MAAARALQPGMVARGGGVKDITAQAFEDNPGSAMVIVYLWVDTKDAMGANAVNTLCEALAPRVAEIIGGTVGLRILSNLSTRALVTATCELPVEALAHKDLTGAKVRDGIVSASRMAEVDLYRAATHNKGIMNGIDAVAVATGNDWRAIEAGAHAYAGRGEGYGPLSTWSVNGAGALVGRITLPLKVGIVGGNFLANPTVALALRLLDVADAGALARLMAAVGLAQNFAALKALSTTGIQAGHMTLHARSVVASTGVDKTLFDAAVSELLQSGDIKLTRARAIVERLQHPARPQAIAAAAPAPAATFEPSSPRAWGEGFGKLIVLGEHAVVYESHALAVPLNLATQVSIGPRVGPGIHLRIPAWGVDEVLPERPHAGAPEHRLVASIRGMVAALGLGHEAFVMTVHVRVPRAMGLGSSAALAVATVRALSGYFDLKLTDEAVIAQAFEAEKMAHGTPSGVDNALAGLGRPLLFRRGAPAPKITAQRVGAPLPWVVGLSHAESLTSTTVAAVRARHDACPSLYDRLFGQIDALTLEASAAMARGDLEHLGRLMNINHGLLHALDVSTGQIEQLIFEARRLGAWGAKVTGGGGGGSMLALCADAAMQQRVAQGFEHLGYAALMTTTEVTDA
jgi:hydroxymethylglutaryl-CoA reductase